MGAKRKKAPAAITMAATAVRYLILFFIFLNLRQEK
jgi:hypothetical protein